MAVLITNRKYRRKSMLITSKRRFGIEVEFVAQDETNFNRIQRSIHVVPDGSLRPLQFAAEYVSDPLTGKRGEAEVRRVCDILKKYGAMCEDPRTSVHVHLDGCKNNYRIVESAKAPDASVLSKYRVYAFSNKLKKMLTKHAIESICRSQYIGGGYCSTRFDNITYLSLAELQAKPKTNYTYIWLEYEDRTQWLRNMFYFYTKFSDVMEGIVSDSRKMGNMYCIPLGNSYELSDIASCDTMDDVVRVWYKGNSASGHYDNSRYHNVNLHSYWDRHGTVEIRSHGGTIDANKILLWVKLHQHIADKLESVPTDELVLLGNTPKDFLDFINDELLEEYVKRLLGYYSGINVS